MVKFDQPPEKRGGFLARLRGRGGAGSTPTGSGKQQRGRSRTSSASKQNKVDFANCLDSRDGSPSLPPEGPPRSPENHVNQQQSSSSSQPNTGGNTRRVVTPHQSNNPKTMKIRKRSKLPFREEVALDKAPTAREAAFGGPPRYDWIDIVSTTVPATSYLVIISRPFAGRNCPRGIC